MFINVHPTETARSGSCEESIQGKRGTKHYCKQCGFVCDTNRNTRGDKNNISYPNAIAEAVSAGDGTITVDSTAGFKTSGNAVIYDSNVMHAEQFTYTSKTATVFTVSTTIKYDHDADCKVLADARISGGCPFCGSKAWM